jgi:hypothetical protein
VAAGLPVPAQRKTKREEKKEKERKMLFKLGKIILN